MLDQVRRDMAFDLEAVVSLETIRAHSKTNDILTVTDDQLRLYRDAAFEAAQQYTGRWFKGMRWITENIRVPSKYKPVLKHRLQFPPHDGRVYLYGGAVGTKTVIIRGRLLEIDMIQWPYAINNCCNPCADEQADKVMYQTGYSCLADFPAGILVGMLKYIMFSIANPGDIGFQRLNERPVAGRSVISNDSVIASGASAEWDRYRVGVS